VAQRIAFQGELGAYSHQACRQARPDMEAVPCTTFEEVIDKCRAGDVDMAMQEVFLRVHVNLLGVRGAKIGDITEAHGHVVILPQCAGFLRKHGIRGRVSSDNARAAREVAEGGDKTKAALASELAASIYGLDVVAAQIEDQANNTTRFLVMARDADVSRRADKMMTTFTFRVRNIPAALYKAMGGFATNGVNMTKLESYMVGGSFTATEFYADIEGHPDDPAVARALEELDYFTSSFTMLGVYPADRERD
jgi:prephenate dehydratase